MVKKIGIAFDLDGVIIDKPPIIPKRVIERLFRGAKKSGLHYKIPKQKPEIIIRKLSHFYLFRPPLTANIEFIRKLKKTGKYRIYIITGRYSFLKSETKEWFKKRKINKLFDRIFINELNEQPHLFKQKILDLIKPAVFVDDDQEVIDFLSEANSLTKFVCLPYRTDLCKIKIF